MPDNSEEMRWQQHRHDDWGRASAVERVPLGHKTSSAAAAAERQRNPLTLDGAAQTVRHRVHPDPTPARCQGHTTDRQPTHASSPVGRTLASRARRVGIGRAPAGQPGRGRGGATVGRPTAHPRWYDRHCMRARVAGGWQLITAATRWLRPMRDADDERSRAPASVGNKPTSAFAHSFVSSAGACQTWSFQHWGVEQNLPIWGRDCCI